MSGFLQRILRFSPQGRYPLVFALSMTVGAAWYFSIWHEPALRSLLGAAICAFMAMVYARRLAVPGLVFLMLLSVFGATFGALSGKVASLRLEHPVMSRALGPVLVEGWISDVEPGHKGIRLRLNVHAIDGLAVEETPKSVRLTHTSGFKVEAGRFVRCWAVIRPLPRPVLAGDYAFDRQAWYEGLGGVGYVQGRCRGGTLGAPKSLFQDAQLRVSETRRQLAKYVVEAAGERAGGFAAALASGDRSFMAIEDQEALRGSGLAHLLAISGLHMGIVGGLAYLIFWRILALIEPLALRVTVRKPAAILALAASFTYLVISGASVSTQRAFVMSAVFFGAILIDRAALSLRSLAIAMILIILMAPWSVLTPGYQMSFAATGALIATYEAWQRRMRARPEQTRRGISFWFKSLVVTSTVSSLATIPFALFHFDRFAGLGLIANLVAMPIISLVSAPLAAASIMVAPLGLSDWPLRAFGLSLEGVLKTAHAFSRWGAEQSHALPHMPATSLTAFTAALILACVLRGMLWRGLGAICFGSIGAALWICASVPHVHWAPSGDIYLADRAGRVQAIKLLKGEGLPPLRYSDLPFDDVCPKEDDCMLRLGDAPLHFIRAPISEEACLSPEAAILLVLHEEPLNCPMGVETTLLRWSDVLAENGITYEQRGARFIKLEKPSCGEKPWRTCPD